MTTVQGPRRSFALTPEILAIAVRTVPGTRNWRCPRRGFMATAAMGGAVLGGLSWASLARAPKDELPMPKARQPLKVFPVLVWDNPATGSDDQLAKLGWDRTRRGGRGGSGPHRRRAGQDREGGRFPGRVCEGGVGQRRGRREGLRRNSRRRTWSSCTVPALRSMAARTLART